MRESFAGKMCVQTAQSAKASFADTHALEVGQNDAARVPDDDVFDVAVAIDERADLPVDFVRNFRKLAGKFLRDNLSRRDASFIELFKSLNLIVL